MSVINTKLPQYIHTFKALPRFGGLSVGVKLCSMATGKKRLNPETGKLFNRGDTRENDNRVFNAYTPSRVKKSGYIYETWVLPHKLNKKVSSQKQKEIYQQRKAVSKSRVGKKRINPETDKYYKLGDARKKDNRVFVSYETIHVDGNGYFYEGWFAPKKYIERKIQLTNQRCKQRAKKDKVPFNIDANYLISIFPKNNKCPVLGIKMQFGGNDIQISPSVDKIIPKKGYVKGNVVWMSYRANSLKTNASIDELKNFAKWIKKTLK